MFRQIVPVAENNKQGVAVIQAPVIKPLPTALAPLRSRNNPPVPLKKERPPSPPPIVLDAHQNSSYTIGPLLGEVFGQILACPL